MESEQIIMNETIAKAAVEAMSVAIQAMATATAESHKVWQDPY